MELWLHEELKHISQDKKQSAFDYLMQLQGKIFRKRDGRCTQQISLNGNNYFIKQFNSISLKGFIKILFSFKFYNLSIKNEYLTLKKLQKTDILAPSVYAYGFKPFFNPAKLKSFIIMESLTDNTVSLTDFCNTWTQTPPSFKLRKAITNKIASIARNLRLNNIIHQDLYFHHLLLDINSINAQDIKIYLIDFHRAFTKKQINMRWFIKDLAGLYCCSKFIRTTNRDIFRFLKAYYDLPLRDILRNESEFLNKVKLRGEKTYIMERNKKHKLLTPSPQPSPP